MINFYLFTAGILAFCAGLMHSIFGERFFIPKLRLSERQLDIGNEKYINRTLRSAWHLATVACWSSASLLILFAFHPGDATMQTVVEVIAVFYMISGVLSIFISHGRQPLWLLFFIMSLLCVIGL